MQIRAFNKNLKGEGQDVTPVCIKLNEASVTQSYGIQRNLLVPTTRGIPLPSHVQLQVRLLLITSISCSLMQPCGKLPIAKVPLQLFIPLDMVRVGIHMGSAIPWMASTSRTLITSSFHNLEMSILCWDSMLSSLEFSATRGACEAIQIWKIRCLKRRNKHLASFWTWFWHRSHPKY